MARALLQKSIGLILAHASFEGNPYSNTTQHTTPQYQQTDVHSDSCCFLGTTKSALEVLTDVVSAYFKKLGKVLNILQATSNDPKVNKQKNE